MYIFPIFYGERPIDLRTTHSLKEIWVMGKTRVTPQASGLCSPHTDCILTEIAKLCSTRLKNCIKTDKFHFVLN